MSSLDVVKNTICVFSSTLVTIVAGAQEIAQTSHAKLVVLELSVIVSFCLFVGLLSRFRL